MLYYFFIFFLFIPWFFQFHILEIEKHDWFRFVNVSVLVEHLSVLIEKTCC